MNLNEFKNNTEVKKQSVEFELDILMLKKEDNAQMTHVCIYEPNNFYG